MKPYLQEADGITISGGDPFEQPRELARLVQLIQTVSPKEILIYTGYTLEQIKQDPTKYWDQINPYIQILIDGPYVEALNDNKPLRGSSNQIIHFFDENTKATYQPLFEKPRVIQDFIEDGAIYIFGIPPKGFRKELKNKLHKDGFKTTL
jgi:anaerobic ribonucleoside-triphosphate reductase activating protein